MAPPAKLERRRPPKPLRSSQPNGRAGSKQGADAHSAGQPASVPAARHRAPDAKQLPYAPPPQPARPKVSIRLAAKEIQGSAPAGGARDGPGPAQHLPESRPPARTADPRVVGWTEVRRFFCTLHTCRLRSTASCRYRLMHTLCNLDFSWPMWPPKLLKEHIYNAMQVVSNHSLKPGTEVEVRSIDGPYLGGWHQAHILEVRFWFTMVVPLKTIWHRADLGKCHILSHKLDDRCFVCIC